MYLSDFDELMHYKPGQLSQRGLADGSGGKGLGGGGAARE